ncbi:MAG: hypothetical protein Q7J35_05365 [Candidatus Methanoperedens sp.]|nr:hypothetical protein [Candidatus Methanoperedens sp.]
MAATVSIAETNGTAPGTETASITNSNMGDTDAVNLVPADYPVAPSTNSFEKWQKFNVTSMGGSSRVKTLKVWRPGALGTGATHKTNARETSYAGAETYNDPSKTDRSATYHYSQTMPTSEPAGANLGIGGSLTGEITTVGKSDFLVHQLQLDGTAVAGVTLTGANGMTYKYTEVA